MQLDALSTGAGDVTHLSIPATPRTWKRANATVTDNAAARLPQAGG
jgi:hypothetical protein